MVRILWACVAFNVRVHVVSSKLSLAFFDRNAIESKYIDEGAKVWMDGSHVVGPSSSGLVT